jgi:PAS domain-containing protein
MSAAVDRDGIESLRAQVRLLERAMAVTMVVMFLALAVAWLLRMIDIDIAPAAWTLTGFAVLHAAIVIAADRAENRTFLRRLLYVVPLPGVVLMALLWHFGGGVSHPALALMLVLPVLGAAALPRAAFAYDTAAYSIVAVAAFAAISSPDLGWYIAQLGIPGAAAAAVAGESVLVREPFPGTVTTPSAIFVFIATFAIVQLTAAAVATKLARHLRVRLATALHITDVAAAEVLPALALRSTPASAAIVISATAQIVQTTKQFAQRMLLHNEGVAGRELFSVLAFDDLGAVRALLASGGAIPFCRYRVGAEERIASVAAETFAQEGVAYTSVVINDWNDAAYLAAAAESLPDALLVIGSDARLRYANPAAATLFGEVYAGRDAALVFGEEDWWRAASPTTRQIALAGRSYEAVSTRVRMFGGDAFLVVVRAEER